MAEILKPGETRPTGGAVTLERFQPLDHPLALALPRDARAVSWHEHIPFGMALVPMLRPRVLVELGVHTGDSYLAFCQAVVASGAGTRCFGVDNWRGDAHAGFYGDEVLRDLRTRHDETYGSFSTLVQATFDDACGTFQAGAIDLLHIDGFHTYEAVRHDFETWLPKLSSCGVVLLHDVCVRERNFGVYRLWEELQSRWPSFTFEHGYGLGVLAVGREVPQALIPLLGAPERDRAVIRGLFEALGKRVGAEVRNRDLAATIAELDRRIASLDGRYREAERLTAMAEQARTVAEQARAAAEQARAAAEQARAAAERASAQAVDRARNSSARADEIEASFAAVTNSISWKLGRGLTAPFRRVLGRGNGRAGPR